jgi:SNF2 family DNA or RNA helicase
MQINDSVANHTLAEYVEADKDFKVSDETGGWEKMTGVNGKATSLNNVLMQLRKCCNHPYLLQVRRKQMDGQID